MALSFVTYSSSGFAATDIVSPLLTVANGDIVVIVACFENNPLTDATIVNSGVGLTWSSFAFAQSTGFASIKAWWAIGDANGNRTVTVSHTGQTNLSQVLLAAVATGGYQPNPIPAGNVLPGFALTGSARQSITPLGLGSLLIMAAVDSNATNTMAGATNCNIEEFKHVGGSMDGAMLDPTVNPRADQLPFVFGEDDTGGKVTYLVFEIAAVATGLISLVLGDYTLDQGLSGLDTACNKIYICAAAPTSYADATSGANSLGNKNWGAGNAFGSPTAVTGGRQITSIAITDGTVTTNGTVAAWAAVDSVNSRLLAYGTLTGGIAVTASQVFTLGPLTFNLQRT